MPADRPGKCQVAFSEVFDFSGKHGGRTRARTWDPLIKSQLLYQLSYAPGTDPEFPVRDGCV